jgi:hypothetical protein
MDIFDEVAAQGDEGRKQGEAYLQEVWQRDVVSILDPLDENAEQSIKMLGKYRGRVTQVRANVLKSPYKTDPIVGRIYDSLGRAMENETALTTGRKEYRRKSWRDLLNRQGNFDINAVRNIVGEIRGYFSIVSARAIEDDLKHLKSRLAYLREVDERNRLSTAPQPDRPGVATIVPPLKKNESADAASEHFDPRLPT